MTGMIDRHPCTIRRLTAAIGRRPPGSPPSRRRQTVDLVRIKKIAVGEPERIAAGDHRVAILEFDEAAIHRAACDDNAKLAFPAMPIPAIDVRLLAHESLPSVPRSST